MQGDEVRQRTVRSAVRGVLFATWIFPLVAMADAPQPPCGLPPLPPYADAGAPAIVRTWHGKTLLGPWVPPACLQWRGRSFAALVAVAGRIDGNADKAQLLKRLTSTAGMQAIRYWSYSRKIWRNLFAELDTLAGPDRTLKRADLSLDEIRTGQNYFMWQKENSIASGMVLRGRFDHISERSIVFQQVNLSAWYVLLITLLAPEEYETAYFLERGTNDVWYFYSLTRFGSAERPLADAQLASIVNRSVAVYRYVAGVPTDREPPAAP